MEEWNGELLSKGKKFAKIDENKVGEVRRAQLINNRKSAHSSREKKKREHEARKWFAIELDDILGAIQTDDSGIAEQLRRARELLVLVAPEGTWPPGSPAAAKTTVLKNATPLPKANTQALHLAEAKSSARRRRRRSCAEKAKELEELERKKFNVKRQVTSMWTDLHTSFAVLEPSSPAYTAAPPAGFPEQPPPAASRWRAALARVDFDPEELQDDFDLEELQAPTCGHPTDYCLLDDSTTLSEAPSTWEQTHHRASSGPGC